VGNDNPEGNTVSSDRSQHLHLLHTSISFAFAPCCYSKKSNIVKNMQHNPFYFFNSFFLVKGGKPSVQVHIRKFSCF